MSEVNLEPRTVYIGTK